MMNAEALRVNKALDDRFKLVRAWIDNHPDVAPKLKHLGVHFSAWDDYQAENILSRDPTALQGFEGELAQCESEAARYGYVPGDHVTVGDVADRTPGGVAAQQVDEAAKLLEEKLKNIPDPTKAIPWYYYAGGALGFAALAGGALKIGIEFARAVGNQVGDEIRGNRRTR